MVYCVAVLWCGKVVLRKIVRILITPPMEIVPESLSGRKENRPEFGSIAPWAMKSRKTAAAYPPPWRTSFGRWCAPNYKKGRTG